MEISKKNIVLIGGGTGLSSLLKVLKNYTGNITAIVTVADDGGNSGMLRKDLNILPPGDIRSCLVALSNINEDLELLFKYRFSKGKLKDQSLGNLIIAAMNDITGDFYQSVNKIGEILKITGKVYPMTLSSTKLCALLENGKKIRGESKIPLASVKNGSKIKRIFLDPQICYPMEESKIAIRNADLIILAPGSLYTSIIPNLLVEGIVDEIDRSRAKKVYIANAITQNGETDNYTLADHVKAILNHSRMDFLDYVIVNNKIPSQEIISPYLDKGCELITAKQNDFKIIEGLGIKIIEENLISIEDGLIRHKDSSIIKVLNEIIKVRLV